MLTNPYVTLALLGAVAFCIGKFLYKKDDQIEDQRRAYIAARDFFKGIGLELTPKFLEDLAVGDYDGALMKVLQLRELMTDPKQLALESERVLSNLLKKALDDTDHREKVFAAVAEKQKALAAPVEVKVTV